MIPKSRVEIFDDVLKQNDTWGNQPDWLMQIIDLADRHNDGYKRVVIEGKTYYVPIADIIAKGIKAEEVPLKYEEEK